MAGSPNSFTRIHELPKTSNLCADFLHLQQMLARSRSYYDDNIVQRLNTINTEDPRRCRQFWETLMHIHQDRKEKLFFCMELLRERLVLEKDSMVLQKELSLLESEAIVEDIACEQSAKIFHTRQAAVQYSLPSDFCPRPVFRPDWPTRTAPLPVPFMSDDEFPARLFPTSFTLLHCPYREDCSHDVPFTDPLQLVEHVASEHGLFVSHPKAVLPFLDRYLEARMRDPNTCTNINEDADRALRYALQQERLQEILNLQAQERVTLHRTGRHCLFCPLYALNHPELFSHMYREHSFNIGHLDNLVMVGEFLDILQRRIDERVCIYCEGRFPSMPILKKHLKNKGHYRIHPQNHLYDKYYIVNYLLPGTLYDAQAEERIPSEAADDEGDNDTSARAQNDGDAAWEELDEELAEPTICLLCPQSHHSVEACLEHMHQIHDFDWQGLIMREQLDDTEIIQLLNYMRSRQIDLGCPYCPPPPDKDDQDDGDDCGVEDETAFPDEISLANHLSTHYPSHTLPLKSYWKTIRFLFPVLEDDPLLWHASGDSIDICCRGKDVKANPPFVAATGNEHSRLDGAR